MLNENNEDNFIPSILTFIDPFIKNDKIDILDIPEIVLLILDVYNNSSTIQVEKQMFLDFMTNKIFKLFNEKNLIKEYQKINFEKMLLYSFKLALFEINFGKKKSKCLFFTGN
jgi:hypothetical protein